jgi:hypothetical protein
MTHLFLNRAGCDRLETIVKKLEAAADKGIADPLEAHKCLGDIRVALYQLRQIVYSGGAVSAPATGRDPLGPGAA